MADSEVILNSNSTTGKKVRTRSLIGVGGDTVEQQIIGEVFNGFAAPADQTGTGAVLSFTLSPACDLVWVRAVGGIARADPSGGTPSSTVGAYCADGEPQPIPYGGCATLKVYAPGGVAVSVWGYAF